MPRAISGPASRWQTVTLAPRALRAMAICAAGALATLSMNNEGDAASGPSSRICLSSASVLVEGPKAVAITTAVPASPSPSQSPAQRRAMRAAVTASFEGGLMRRASPGESQPASSPGGTRQARRALCGR